MASGSTQNHNKSLKHGIHILFSALIIILLSFSLLRYITEPQDNDRCHGMLNKGRWMTEEYKEWQPSGCMAKKYGAKDISQCIGHSKVIYIGDSIMREQYYSMAEFLNLKRPKAAQIHNDQHAYSKEHDIDFQMWWDPYLNTTKTIELLQGKSEIKPTLLILGSGVWYMRRTGSDYLRGWKEAIDRVFDGVIHYSIADKVLLSPVEILETNLLIPERVATLTPEKISIMNHYLDERTSLLDQPMTPLVVPFVWNEIVTSSKNQTKDGLHFQAPVTKAQAQLALNYRCNQQLDKSSFPIDTTCCYTYPSPAWYQNTIFLFFLIFVPLGFCVLHTSGRFHQIVSHIFPQDYQTLLGLFIFGLSILHMYLGDRSQLFGKIDKQYNVTSFSILMVCMVLLGLVTLNTKKGEETNATFLNRDQTDEWKGWMQLVILIYHFMGASRIPGIYNPVRILVAAYLFQTGYGHFYFFYKKANFGIARILNVMVRLNLLTCVLAYTMKTNYLFYYFSPLVSFWFGVIWITMRFMSNYNTSVVFLLSKIIIMSILTGFIIHMPGLLEGVFHVLFFLFKIQWDVIEWRFRLSLDAWIVYIGMLCAYFTIQLNEYKISQHYPRAWKISKQLSLVFSLVGLIGFFLFEVRQTKANYNGYHPYLSWVPILSFVVLRNFSVFGRQSYSRFFAFIGKISLETFIGQFHMWLAADTKGLLVILPNASWVIQSSVGWWMNLLVSSLVFFFICYHLSQATGILTRWICSGVQNTMKPITNTIDSVPLLPTNNSKDEEDDTSSESSTLTLNNEQGKEDERTSKDSALEWDEIIQEKNVWYRSFSFHFILENYWIRSILYFILMGIINRFCV